MNTRCLVVDIGNTSTVLALANGESITRLRRLPTHGYSISGLRRAVSNTIGTLRIQGCVLCSVVPGVTAEWHRELARAAGIPPIRVGTGMRMGVRLSYPRPSTLGEDRLANVCAAVHRFGSPVIAVDFGTATTFDVVSPHDVFVGGVIAPGPAMMTDYLSERTALLPRLPSVRGRIAAIGKDTISAMRIAAVVGYRGMTEAILQHLLAFPGMRGAVICATGGYARQSCRGVSLPIIVDPLLTLRGLGRMFALNKSPSVGVGRAV